MLEQIAKKQIVRGTRSSILATKNGPDLGSTRARARHPSRDDDLLQHRVSPQERRRERGASPRLE
jgi:hypothetical protein